MTGAGERIDLAQAIRDRNAARTIAVNAQRAALKAQEALRDAETRVMLAQAQFEEEAINA